MTPWWNLWSCEGQAIQFLNAGVTDNLVSLSRWSDKSLIAFVSSHFYHLLSASILFFFLQTSRLPVQILFIYLLLQRHSVAFVNNVALQHDGSGFEQKRKKEKTREYEKFHTDRGGVAVYLQGITCDEGIS